MTTRPDEGAVRRRDQAVRGKPDNSVTAEASTDDELVIADRSAGATRAELAEQARRARTRR